MLQKSILEYQNENHRAVAVDWIKISEKLEGKRSSHQCNHRWHGFLKSKIYGNLKQGPWTESEVSMQVQY